MKYIITFENFKDNTFDEIYKNLKKPEIKDNTIDTCRIYMNLYFLCCYFYNLKKSSSKDLGTSYKAILHFDKKQWPMEVEIGMDDKNLIFGDVLIPLAKTNDEIMSLYVSGDFDKYKSAEIRDNLLGSSNIKKENYSKILKENLFHDKFYLVSKKLKRIDSEVIKTLDDVWNTFYGEKNEIDLKSDPILKKTRQDSFDYIMQTFQLFYKFDPNNQIMRNWSKSKPIFIEKVWTLFR